MATLDELVEALESDPSNENRDALIIELRPLIKSYARNYRDKEEYISIATLKAVELVTQYQCDIIDGRKRENAVKWLCLSLRYCKIKHREPHLVPEPRCSPKNEILISEVLSRLQKHEQKIAQMLLDGYNAVSIQSITGISRKAISQIKGKMFRWMNKK
jgi:DNA-directed RNA polymerase specialized sigma subunit